MMLDRVVSLWKPKTNLGFCDFLLVVVGHCGLHRRIINSSGVDLPKKVGGGGKTERMSVIL